MINDIPETHPSNLADLEPTQLLETIPSAIIFLDQNGTVIYANARATEIMKVTEPGLTGTILWESVPSLVVTPLYTAVGTAMCTQQSLNIMYDSPLTFMTFQVHLSPRHNGVTLFFQETLDSASQQEAFLKQQWKYHLLLENSADGVVILTPQGLIQDISQRLLQHTQMRREEVLGTLFPMLPVWQHAPTAKHQLQTAIEQACEGKIVAFDIQLHPNSDEESHLTLTLTPQFNEQQQRVEAIVCICQDITERVQREQRRDMMQSMLNHEIRTPLTSLKLQTQMLQKKLKHHSDASMSTPLSLMETQIDVMIRIIEDVLDPVSTPDDALHYRHELVDLNDVLREKVHIVQQLQERHTIVLHNATTPSPMLGDRDRLGQVVLNLINNAIKYSPAANEIEIDIINRAETVTVSIRDHGIGMTHEQQKRIFERFYRAVPSDQTSIPGLGIGLYIVSKIVKQHRGTISVESTPGKGSTFHVTFPLHQQ
ncbi:PAS domain-containing sensor histidine kinase [Dictyobacter alpinus]|uniref:histidine kinase n=1 Tax=Dictyobacter alpinus TaxID=2014873 RepID=A0A402BKR7_9CHLR|nr:PAS domain-containing sensor histidine kinase [Dictyobacter alpinus]GCE31958.1 PAS domain-containing sensor histidine kinase [Dictyobacter alpinus]